MRPDPRPRRRVASLRFHVALILAGLLLRGIAVDQTPALTDEAFTFWRTSGTLGQLLDTLRNDAFVPLHYQIVWCLTQIFGQGVWVLRLPAAVAGVLMPLAVGRLARTMFGRPAERPAAVLALASAYFAFFARNAKMYLPAWLMLALALGSVLAYARSRWRLTLLTFTLFGIAAGGLHSLVLLPLATSPILAAIAARRRRLRTTLLATAATLAVFVAPTVYYLTFNRWFVVAGGLSRVVDGRPAPHDNGLGWVERWQGDRSPFNILVECASSFLANVEWPSETPTQMPSTSTPEGQAFALTVAALGAAAFIALAAIVAALVRRAGRERGRWLTIIVVLIALPLYLFYLRSFRSLAGPWAAGWPALVGAIVAAAVLARRTPRDHRPMRLRTTHAVAWVAIATTVLLLTWAGAKVVYARAPLGPDGLPAWDSLWMPRYAAIVAAPLLATLGAAIAALPTRTFRGIALAALALPNLAMTLMPHRYATQPPTPRFCRDLVAAAREPGLRVTGERNRFRFMFPNLPGPYYDLVRAADFDVDPPTFRVGTEWPYRPGPSVAALQQRLTRVPTPRAAFADAGATRVILWTGPNPSAPPAGWIVARDERLDWFLITTFEPWSSCRRIEYRRAP